VKSSIDTGNPSHARLYRQDNLPVEGYYSAWFYIPKPYAVGQFWNIFEFSGRADPTNPNTGVAVWSLDLRQQSTGELTWYVYDNAGSRELKPSNPVVAPIRWWHLSVAGFASRPSYVRRPTAPVG
jgi:hypothetical protein